MLLDRQFSQTTACALLSDPGIFPSLGAANVLLGICSDPILLILYVALMVAYVSVPTMPLLHHEDLDIDISIEKVRNVQTKLK